MSDLFTEAGALLARGELREFLSDGDTVVVIKKPPVHQTVTFSITDKNQGTKLVNKSYTFPRELESAVCMDILKTMYELVKDHPETIKTWNSLNVARLFPALSEPAQTPDETETSQEPKLSDFYNFGVYKMKDWNKWQAYYTVTGGKRKHIGYFETKELAQEAGLKKVSELRTADKGTIWD